MMLSDFERTFSYYLSFMSQYLKILHMSLICHESKQEAKLPLG